MYKNLNLILFFFLFKISAQAQNSDQLNSIAFEKAIHQVDSAQILDVRTAKEYNSGFIAGSLQADWNSKQEFFRRISFLDSTKPVFIYCLAGGRSAAAAKYLRKNGFRKVIELAGGIVDWRTQGLPLIANEVAIQFPPDSLEAIIQTGEPVLLDFGASWCPPCRKMEPTLNKVMAAKKGAVRLVKIDGGKDQLILAEYNVSSLPVLIYFKNKQLIWRKDGIADEAELQEKLQ
ncbi:MAG: hypothetical protein RLY16_399 [Bacteroidota bacterium]|jgi:rhodanese-related sulfurtransferase